MRLAVVKYYATKIEPFLYKAIGNFFKTPFSSSLKIDL